MKHHDPSRAEPARCARRIWLAGLVALLLLPALAGRGSAQSPGTRISGVSVEVGRRLGVQGERLRACLQDELVGAFSDRFGAGSGPRLLVRIGGLSLPGYVGGESRVYGSGAPNDYLEGEVLVVGHNGEVLSRRPQLSALPSSSGGAWYLPDAEERRLAALCRHFAQWARRRF